MLEGCRHNGVGHLVYASSSSVYGANTNMPFSVHQNVDHPLSFYAATKKANELMAHTYSAPVSLPITGLRFFTVYGPWGRPDMALFLFTRNILEGKPIDVFNYGRAPPRLHLCRRHRRGRDPRLRPASPLAMRTGTATAPPTIKPRAIPHFQHRQQPTGGTDCTTSARWKRRSASRRPSSLLPLQPGDVPGHVCRCLRRSQAAVGYKPATPVREGVRAFVDWYLEYYKDGGPPQPKVVNLG